MNAAADQLHARLETLRKQARADVETVNIIRQRWDSDADLDGLRGEVIAAGAIRGEVRRYADRMDRERAVLDKVSDVEQTIEAVRYALTLFMGLLQEAHPDLPHRP